VKENEKAINSKATIIAGIKL